MTPGDGKRMRILAWPLKKTWNPYTGMVYSHLPAGVEVDGWPGDLRRKYSVWHMHWPDSLLNIPNRFYAAYKVAGMFATIDFLRARGTKIVWTMHNFASHEALHPGLERWFWKHFIPRVDGAISLSAAGLEMGQERFPRLREVPATVIPHGHYRSVYPPGSGSRKALGIPDSARVAMFFGAVRAYKNVDALVRAFRGVKRADAVLYVAGKPNSNELADRIMKEAFEDRRVALKFEFVDDKDVATVLSAADLVALPYREVLNSGSALLALSCSRPVLVPERGSMGELKKEFGETWVRTFRGELDESKLEEALDWSAEARPAVCPMPENYQWEHIGEETVRFFERVIGGAGKRAAAAAGPAGENASQAKAAERAFGE